VLNGLTNDVRYMSIRRLFNT